MSFTNLQVRQLKSSVRRRHVREREVDGKTLHYLEGWWIVSEANRIFGFDAWERETVSSECVWRSPVGERFGAAYLTRVRVSVRAGDRMIVREGLGAGEAVASTPGQAHERASKAAETDATKRALSTFGSRFGLSLYGERGYPGKIPHERVTLHNAAARVVRSVGDRVRSREVSPEPPMTNLEREDADLSERASDAGWRRTRGAHPFRRGTAHANTEPGADQETQETHTRRPDMADRTVVEPSTEGEPTHADAVEAGPTSHSKPEPVSVHKEVGSSATGGARAFESRPSALLPVYLPPINLPVRIDKSVLTLSEPKRRRDRAHLKFVARQPCLVCGRTPSQAHHLRIAQPRALGRKVSDEFTVPLCALHHHDLHMNGNEREWWWGRNIDPLPVADQLWAKRTEDEP